jgi:hypothetical protein
LVQGLTFKEKIILCLSPQKNQNNHIFRFGFLYVIVSRPTEVNLIHMSEQEFTRDYFEKFVKKNDTSD